MEDETLRIRDPIHDLITFNRKEPRDALAWGLINTREFQRLRRIRQLGFSEQVFPGATHTRFSHCLGAFHIARSLLGIIKRGVSPTDFDESKAFVAAIAALLHDLGHGPFSHVFEGVQSELTTPHRHEEWTCGIVRGDTEVHKVLYEHDHDLPEKIALLLGHKDPTDGYDAVVSSQFDADRLDYLQRDRYMSGTQMGGFDYAWLLDCLEITKINVAIENDDYVEVATLRLSNKGLLAAEGYLLARFHLYSQVYLHKTTRSAERMLAALLKRFVDLVKSNSIDSTGLRDDEALVTFFQRPDVESYLELDDSVVWSALGRMTHAKDDYIREISNRLKDRLLYKCINVGESARHLGGDSLSHFKRRLKEDFADKLDRTILRDEVSLTAYGWRDYEDPGALQKVLVADATGRSRDIAELSETVRSIQPRKVFRVYCSNAAELDAIEKLQKEVIH
jgi:HD superfamily phosphohydrolase